MEEQASDKKDYPSDRLGGGEEISVRDHYTGRGRFIYGLKD